MLASVRSVLGVCSVRWAPGSESRLSDPGLRWSAGGVGQAEVGRTEGAPSLGGGDGRRASIKGQAADAWSMRAGADDGVTVVGHEEAGGWAVEWCGVAGGGTKLLAQK